MTTPSAFTVSMCRDSSKESRARCSRLLRPGSRIPVIPDLSAGPRCIPAGATLHQLIMTSNAYRMSSQANADALAKEPVNNLLWRFDMRRLSAEEAMCSASAAFRIEPWWATASRYEKMLGG